MTKYTHESSMQSKCYLFLKKPETSHSNYSNSDILLNACNECFASANNAHYLRVSFKFRSATVLKIASIIFVGEKSDSALVKCERKFKVC